MGLEIAMSGFLEALKESLLGREVDLPICSLSQRPHLHVSYFYYADRPQSDRLRFRRGNRTVFEIMLPCGGAQIGQLIAVAQDVQSPYCEDRQVFGFWLRLFLRIGAGRLRASRTLFAGSIINSAIKLPFSSIANVEMIRCYRIAVCQRGIRESVVLISTQNSTTKKRYNTDRRSDINWLRLSGDELQELVRQLQVFLGSKEYAGLPKQ